MKKNKYIVFRSKLLPLSETFVYNQTKYLNKLEPLFTGITNVNGFPIKDKNTINDGGLFGRLLEIIFKVFYIDFNLTKKLKKQSPLLMHAHFGPDGWFGLKLTKKLKIPFVVTFHGYDATTLDSQIKNSFYSHRLFYKNRKKVFEHASKIIAVSEFIKDKIIKMGAPQSKVQVHYIGIDVDEFRFTSLEKRKKTILFVGRLRQKKGIHVLLKSFEELINKYPDYTLNVIGSGEEKNTLKLKYEHLLDNIKFLGEMSHDKVINHMAQASIFCLPSLTADNGDSEGLPIVLLEAMALGTPVVSTYHAGIPEAIIDGQNGLLAKENNINELTKKLDTLIQSSELRELYAKNARKTVEEKFSLRKQNQKLEEIYLKALK